jgi:PEGA domain
MRRFLKVPLIAVLALAGFLTFAPVTASAAMRGGRVVIVGGGFYGRGWYGPGWGWGGWYGPGWYYGPWGWGPGYYVPNAGKVKIVTPDKNASVYIDGGYAGPVAKLKKFSLRPGNHEIALRDPSGHTFYQERVQVIPGKTIEIHTNYQQG